MFWLHLPKTLPSTTSINKVLVSGHSKQSCSFNNFSLYANSSNVNIMSFLSDDTVSNLQCTLGTFWDSDSFNSVAPYNPHCDLGKVRRISYRCPTCKNPRCAINWKSSRFCITISLSLPKLSSSSPKWTRWCSANMNTKHLQP